MMQTTVHGVTYEADSETSDHRTYHLTVPVKAGHFFDAGTGFHMYGARSEKPHATAVALSEVRGLQGFYFHDGYELKVRKATVYSWADVHPLVESIVAVHNDTASWPTYEVGETQPERELEEANLEDADIT